MTNQTLIKEVKETAIDFLRENTEHSNIYGCDLHHEIFNTDYFCVYTHECKKYLEEYGVFEAIEKVKEYEEFNFGEVTTDLSDPFKLLNMLVYILGEEYLNNSNTLTNELWNIYIPQEKFQVIIDELKGE